MSIKNFDENSEKWIVHSTNLAKHVILLDLAGLFESNNVEDALKEINEDLKKTYTKDEVDTKLDNIDLLSNFYIVNTLTERDDIPIDSRQEGILCWVKDERVIYQLIDGIENSNWIEFKTNSDDIEITLNYDDISYIGSEEPTNEDVIWFDDSIDGEIEIVSSNPIIDELKSIIQSMSNKINELEKKVEYLILNGGSSSGGSEEEDTTGIYLLLEDGSKLLLEDGSGIVLEDAIVSSNVNGISLEDGSSMLLEDGSKLLLEN